MNTPNEMAPETAVFEREDPALPQIDAAEDVGAVNLHQEINERRARLENTDLLHGLRGL